MNRLRAMFGIFNWHKLKKDILSYQTTYRYIPRLEKYFSRSPTWLNLFSTAVLKNNIKSKKMCTGFLFLHLDLKEIIYLRFLCLTKKNSYTLFDYFELRPHFYRSHGHIFCAAVTFLAMCKVLKDLDRIY